MSRTLSLTFSQKARLDCSDVSKKKLEFVLGCFLFQ